MVEDNCVLVAEVEKLRAEIANVHKAYGCEVRDPNGTIWEHAAKLEREVERLSVFEKAMRSMAAQFVHPRTTAEQMAEKILARDATPDRKARGAWVRFHEDGVRVLDVMHGEPRSDEASEYVWCEEYV